MGRRMMAVWVLAGLLGAEEVPRRTEIRWGITLLRGHVVGPETRGETTRLAPGLDAMEGLGAQVAFEIRRGLWLRTRLDLGFLRGSGPEDSRMVSLGGDVVGRVWVLELFGGIGVARISGYRQGTKGLVRSGVGFTFSRNVAVAGGSLFFEGERRSLNYAEIVFRF